MTSTLVTGMSELVTNDETLSGADDSERLGVLAEAAVVVEDGVVRWVGSGRATPPAEPRSPHAFTGEEARVVLAAGRDAGLDLRVHGNQLGPGPGVQLAVQMSAASVDHCTFLSNADVDARAAAADTRRGAPGRDGGRCTGVAAQ